MSKKAWWMKVEKEKNQVEISNQFIGKDALAATIIYEGLVVGNYRELIEMYFLYMKEELGESDEVIGALRDINDAYQLGIVESTEVGSNISEERKFFRNQLKSIRYDFQNILEGDFHSLRKRKINWKIYANAAVVMLEKETENILKADLGLEENQKNIFMDRILEKNNIQLFVMKAMDGRISLECTCGLENAENATFEYGEEIDTGKMAKDFVGQYLLNQSITSIFAGEIMPELYFSLLAHGELYLDQIAYETIEEIVVGTELEEAAVREAILREHCTNWQGDKENAVYFKILIGEDGEIMQLFEKGMNPQNGYRRYSISEFKERLNNVIDWMGESSNLEVRDSQEIFMDIDLFLDGKEIWSGNVGDSFMLTGERV